MLLDKGKMTPETIQVMDRWRRSVHNVFAGGRFHPQEKRFLESRLADCLIRSSFSRESMDYLRDQARVR
jgi:hypothetical protein